MKILCVFGQYQYGQKSRGISTEYFSFIPTFEQLGHDVEFFDSWDRSLYQNFTELNNALIECVKMNQPDVIFSVQLGYEIWIETWDFISSNFNCKTINWCTDDSWKYIQHSKFLAPHFDLLVTTYENFIPKYKFQSTNAILSNWAVPVQWIQKPKKANECKYQVTFIGAAHGDRKEKVEYLKSKGIYVECFGYGWDSGAIDAGDIPKIFNESIISLNFANSSGENQIKARVFEVTGSGGFLLTEDAKNLDKIFSKDEIVVYSDLDDCVDKIKYYLENIELRDMIVKKSFEKTSLNYTYANTIEKIISKVISIEKHNVKQKINFEEVTNKHKKNMILELIKYLLISFGTLVYGKAKGKKFARRLVYELSWRIFKENTYKSSGYVGRMFYSE